MNKKMLCLIISLHFWGLIGSQAAKEKGLKSSHEVSQKKGVRLSNFLFTMCAAAALIGKSNATQIPIPENLNVTPLFDVATPDCIPVPSFPTIICARMKDFNRNQSATLNEIAGIDDYYLGYVNELIDNIKTQEEFDYVDNLTANFPNQLWLSSSGNQYRSIAGVSRYPVFNCSFLPANWNAGEYWHWRDTRNQTNPYQPQFKSGALSYQSQPHTQFKKLVWTDENQHGLSRKKLARMNQVGRRNNKKSGCWQK